jgi:Uma2 family endonuclease
MRKTVFPRRPLTLAEYLAWEETTSTKHEFVAGEVYAMTGVTVRHNVITLNLVRHLHGPARARQCSVLATDVKLRADDRIYYPDLMVVCGKAADVELIVNAPSLVAEVTSPSTRSIDRREKLDAYLKIPALRQYLVVDQRRKHVLSYRRADDGSEWLRDEFEGDVAVPVPTLDTRVTMTELYQDVKLPPLTVKEEHDEFSNVEWDDES